ncbi:MAG: chitobiase/beta-hexosaminidase C-terminal domain-containing protein [Terracidiphilus sp.]
MAVLCLGVLLLGAVCPAADAQANEWTWVGGSSTVNQSGVYGTLGTPAAGNIPGGRDSASSWVDSSGNLWLFGGEGYDATGSYGVLNDLWEFSSSKWTWLGGSSTVGIDGGQSGVYGTLRTPAAGNVPGSRFTASIWVDRSGNLWLFGGHGYDASGNQGELNDLWEFNPSTKKWAWMSGSQTNSQSGVYGTLGTPAVGNVPGGRDSSGSWIDGSGNLWLFGGEGLDADGHYGDQNDLWEYNPATNEWAWMGGSNTVNWLGHLCNDNCTPTGTYGTLGAFADENIPGGRTNPSTWTDNSGNIWLFGGYGIDAGGNLGWLNDLWEFNPSTNEWAWMGGSSAINPNSGLPGVYGTLRTPADGNIPGSRQSTPSWTDSNGNFWLLGGWGYDANDIHGYLNDLWQFSPQTKQWTWMGGSSTTPTCTPGPPNCGRSGVYGTLRTAAAGNIPGGRTNPMGWTDNSGYFWLFGGQGYDGSGNFGELNDLWKYQPWATAPTVLITASPTLKNVSSNYQATVTVTNNGTGHAENVQLTTATLGAATGSPLPQYLGTLAAGGGSATVTVTFPLSAGSPGTAVAEKYSGTYTGGTFSASLRAAMLPYPPAATPAFSPVAGTYSSVQTVTISDTTPGAVIYYTTNGSTPATNSTHYSTPITVSTNETIEAIATASGYITSAVGSAAYTLQVSAPTFSPAGGSYSSVQVVTISDASPGAVIYYTTDGLTPTTNSTVYTLPVTVWGSGTVTTFNAMATAFNTSAYGSAAYNIPYVPAALQTPAPGTQLPGTSVTFTWIPGTGGYTWYPGDSHPLFELWVGSTGVGSSNLYNSGSTQATSEYVTGLPSNGETLYVRLYWDVNGAWQTADYTYTASGSPIAAWISSPTSGSTLAGASQAFTWNPGNTATHFELIVGNNGVGTSNLYNSGNVTVTTETVTGLPSNGQPVYARLYSLINGAWQSNDYTYTASGSPIPASMSSPIGGSTLASASQVFTWSPGNVATHFELVVGTTGVGSSNLYNSGNVTVTTETVNNLPTNGQPVYVRLYSLINGTWQSNDYTYTASGSPTPAVLTTPTPGSQFLSSSVQFIWTPGNTATHFELWLGSTGVGSSNLYNSGNVTVTTETVNGLPTNGATVYARLYWIINGTWQYADYTYTAQ